MTKKIFKFRKAIILVLVILVTYIGNSIFIAPYNNAVQAIAYYYGSKGNAVGTIQKKLKSWGYYNGSIDNVYGYQTFTAVKYFH
jgi:N-acetylmuramoyl-L-alanine amidase